jgi:uncharacterized protein (DUF1778 family)
MISNEPTRTPRSEALISSLEETEIIRLSVEDQRLLADALLNPPEPVPALVRAIEQYRRFVQNGAVSGGRRE